MRPGSLQLKNRTLHERPKWDPSDSTPGDVLDKFWVDQDGNKRRIQLPALGVPCGGHQQN